MRMYLNEKIGNPDLFIGRKKELEFLLKWIERIKMRASKSAAILSRRKTGKTALMQRLYNLTFAKNNGVIPFYYEVKEGKKWAVDFCRDFFLTFIYQYIAFKSRKPEYIEIKDKAAYKTAIQLANKENQTHLIDTINAVLTADAYESVDNLWLMVRDAPLTVATTQNESIVQMIDEFQYLNRDIYWDKQKINRADDFAAGYLSTAEYKNAPLLVSGSWVGWLIRDLQKMLPSRFIYWFFENMPHDEAIETIFKYADYEQIPITQEVAFLMAMLTEGNPCYISSLFSSIYPKKDFTTETGLQNTLEFEILNRSGQIRGAWMEYIEYAFSEINGEDKGTTKRIMLYLCKNKEREISRKEIKDNLKLEISDPELEKRLDALVRCDIVEHGSTHFDYQGIKDNIFDKVFRGRYQKEIADFDPNEISNEYKASFQDWKKKYHVMAGKYGQLKGIFGEYKIIENLKYKAFKNNPLYKEMMQNLPEDFVFMPYQSVWKYMSSPVYQHGFEIDVFARACNADEYSLIGEVKNREKKFSQEEALEFFKKVQKLIEMEKITKYVIFVFSINGFTEDALLFFKSNQIAYSNDERLLD